jgi:alpha-glucosidase (family GH31 glycosyl hydrolase)
MPWIQGKELLEMHKYYSRLRARLIPYLYSWAYQSTQRAIPLLRPLTLEFQDDAQCRNILHQYLLGRDLLVVIYSPEAYFPAGCWKDYWTGEIIEGKGERAIQWPEDRGGGLFVRSGGIIPHGPLMQYRGERSLGEIMVYVFPDAHESSMDFYEDDGISLEHRKGEFAITRISTKRGTSGVTIEVGETEGSFEGQVQDRTWSFKVAVDFVPRSVEAHGRDLPETMWAFDKERNEVRIQPLPGPVDIVIA